MLLLQRNGESHPPASLERADTNGYEQGHISKDFPRPQRNACYTCGSEGMYRVFRYHRFLTTTATSGHIPRAAPWPGTARHECLFSQPRGCRLRGSIMFSDLSRILLHPYPSTCSISFRLSLYHRFFRVSMHLVSVLLNLHHSPCSCTIRSGGWPNQKLKIVGSVVSWLLGRTSERYPD